MTSSSSALRAGACSAAEGVSLTAGAEPFSAGGGEGVTLGIGVERDACCSCDSLGDAAREPEAAETSSSVFWDGAE